MAAERKLNRAELSVGLAFVAVGSLAAWEGAHYRIGTLTNMGPGMFPTALGVLLSLMGLGATAQVLWRQGEGEAVSLRAFIAISLGILAWVAAVEPFGLVPATVVLVIASAFAAPPIRPLGTLLLAAVLCVIGDIIFIRLLGVPLTRFGR